MRSDNPLNIPFERLSETEGTLKFVLRQSNLFDSLNQYVCLFSVHAGKSLFKLFRDNDLNLTFVHKRPETHVRTAAIKLYGLSADVSICICLDWSEEQSHLYISDLLFPDDIQHCKANETVERATIYSHQIIPASGMLSSLLFSSNSLAKGHLSTAKGLWDWHLSDVNNLINRLKSCRERQCPITNPTYEFAVIKQCVVMLVKAWEVYAKKRFAEMEENGKKPDIEALLLKFDKIDSTREELCKYVSSTGKSELASLLEMRGRGLINFQNYENCKDAFNKGYGVKFGELPNIGQTLDDIQSYIQLRNVIVHARDEPILGKDPFGAPRPLDLPFIENVVAEFARFIEILHLATE